MTEPTIIDAVDRLHMEVDRHLNIQEAHIEAIQEIPDSFLRDCAVSRETQDARFRAAQDDVKVASIPAAVVNHWYRQGFNIYDKNITPRDIINRLTREGLTAFLCTTKTFG